MQISKFLRNDFIVDFCSFSNVIKENENFLAVSLCLRKIVSLHKATELKQIAYGGRGINIRAALKHKILTKSMGNAHLPTYVYA